MNNQPSIKNEWTCNCGHVNSLCYSFCPNCGQHMPSEISQRVYEEEILLHNGILIDKRIRTMIIIAATILVLFFWRAVLFAVAILVGIISLIFEWIYIWKSAKDMSIVEHNKLKNYIRFTFGFSLCILVILRIVASEMKSIVHTGIGIFFVGWIISFLGGIISSLMTKKRNNITMKNNIFLIALPCVLKVICIAIILWLI